MSKSRHVPLPLLRGDQTGRWRDASGTGQQPCPAGEGPYMSGLPRRQWLFRLPAFAAPRRGANRSSLLPLRIAASTGGKSTDRLRRARRPSCRKNGPKPRPSRSMDDGRTRPPGTENSIFKETRQLGRQAPRLGRENPIWEPKPALQGRPERFFEAFQTVEAGSPGSSGSGEIGGGNRASSLPSSKMLVRSGRLRILTRRGPCSTRA
jgi:hypothetical protein